MPRKPQSPTSPFALDRPLILLYDSIESILMAFPDRIEQSNKEIQVVYNGAYIAKARNSLLVWEKPNTRPQHYFPKDALLRENVAIIPLSSTAYRSEEGWLGEDRYDLRVDDKGTTYSLFPIGKLAGYFKLPFDEMDAWFEDGALTRLPPKNPSRRIDTAAVSAHIIVFVDKQIVATAEHAVILYETGLQRRYYLPATSVVDWRKWKGSEKKTACPYKGEARYFSYQPSESENTISDVAWYYLYPVAESASIAGRLSFDDGKEGVRIAINE